MSIGNFDMELIDHRIRQECDAAISRIQDGLRPSIITECENCGAAIGRLRIHAMPSTKFCIKCATKMEGR